MIQTVSEETNDTLLLALLQGPLPVYFSTEEQFNPAEVEAAIEASLATIRQQFRGVTAKYLTQAFADTIALVEALKPLSPKEQSRQLKDWGMPSPIPVELL